MAKVWKVLALLLVITALVWLSTLWRWQSANVNPDATQLLLHLVVLPLVLTAALLAVVWAVKRLRRYAAAPTVAAAASPSTTPAAAAAPAADARAVPHRVLAAAVQVRAGAAWRDAQSSIAEGSCKAELDATMKDDDGIAIFTAPLADISTDGVATALEDIGSARKGLPADWPGHLPQGEMLRALASLEAIVEQMVGQLESQWPALSAPLASARTTPNAAALLPPMVSVRVGIPARWPVPAQQLASAWLHQLFEPHVEAGLKAAGQSRAMASAARPAVQLHVHPVENAEAHWLLMEQQLQQWQRERQPGLLWALAADSLVGEDTVEQLARHNELFSGQRQQGRVPGEGAAGVLLASPTWPAPTTAPAPLALMHKASVIKRDKSADASGRVTSQARVQAVDDLLLGTGQDAKLIQHLTTDADHRVSRTVEVYETLQERLSHLDASEHALRLGLGCGDIGIARLIACAALTAAQVRESEAPALVLGAQSSFDRLAVLMAPVTPPATAPAPPPAAAPAAAAQAA
jgi:hypothetical protein